MKSRGFARIRSGRRGFRNPFAGIVGGPVMAIIGGAMVFFGWRSYNTTKNFMDRAERASGTVVEVVARSGTDSNGNPTTYYYPVVEFRTASGQSVRQQAATGSNPPSHRVGETVEMVYDPSDPQGARINDFTSIWLLPAVLLGIGAIFALAGVGAFFNSIALIAGLGGLLALLLFWRRKAKREQSPPAGDAPA